MADDAEHAAWLDQQLGEQELGCAAEPSAGVATAEHVGAGTLHAPAAVPPLPARTRIQGLAVCTRAVILWACLPRMLHKSLG